MEQGRNHDQENMNMNQNQEQEQDQPQPQRQPQQRRVRPAGNNQPGADNNNQQHPPPAPPPPQRCPRCDSANTKFCYYNNYSMTQPRYFCKSCRRYWTQGGTLRNVPIGGGCRKSKRSRISGGASSSNSAEVARNQAQQNFAGLVPAQGLRPAGLGTVVQPMGGSLYSGGTLLSSLAGLQSLPAAGMNQPGGGAQLTLGGGGSRFGANLSLLQGLNLSSIRVPAPSPPQPLQFEANNNEFFQPQQGLAQHRSLSSWSHQGFINRGGATSSSGGNAGFWGGGASGSNGMDGGNQAASSFNPNQWSSDDDHPGFNSSQ